MYFLKSTDYEKIIQSDNLTQIINSNQQVLLDAEIFAVADMISHIKHLYDTESAFKTFSEFDITKTYKSGDRVYTSAEGETYYYNISSNGSTNIDIIDKSVWVEGDSRNPQLVTYLIDIILYHIHSRINPRQVPTLRIDRFNNAMNFLKMASAGTLTLDITKRDVANQTGFPNRWGSANTIGKRSNFY